MFEILNINKDFNMIVELGINLTTLKYNDDSAYTDDSFDFYGDKIKFIDKQESSANYIF